MPLNTFHRVGRNGRAPGWASRISLLLLLLVALLVTNCGRSSLADCGSDCDDFGGSPSVAGGAFGSGGRSSGGMGATSGGRTAASGGRATTSGGGLGVGGSCSGSLCGGACVD